MAVSSSRERTSNVELARYRATQGWSAPVARYELTGRTPAISTAMDGEGGVAIAFTDPISRAERVTLASRETLEMAQLPEPGNVRLVRLVRMLGIPGVLATRAIAAQASENTMTWPAVAGGAVAGIAVIGGVLVPRRRGYERAGV